MAIVKRGFNPVKLSELLARPIVAVDYIWHERLVRGTVSIICAKPKVGKSTLSRNLSLCVARGEPFLGWPVKQGPVLYLSLEERKEEVTSDFRAMGADGSEDIQIEDAASVSDVITWLNDKKPALLVVDPLIRLVHIREEKSYAEVYAALGPLIDVARETGTHIHCTHHSSKIAKVSAIDAPIGSTALGGAAGTVIFMRKAGGFRTIETDQRIGHILPETALKFDLVTRRLSLGGLREDVEASILGAAILKVLANEPMTEPEIDAAVQAKTSIKRKAVQELYQSGKITRSGRGVRGDPFKYVACSPVPSPIENNGNEKAFEGASEETTEEKEILVPVTYMNIRNKKTRKFEAPGERSNIDEKLVPAKTGNDANSAKPGTSNSGWWGTAENLLQAGYGCPLDTPRGPEPGPDGTWHLAFTKMKMHSPYMATTAKTVARGTKASMCKH